MKYQIGDNVICQNSVMKIQGIYKTKTAGLRYQVVDNNNKSIIVKSWQIMKFTGS